MKKSYPPLSNPNFPLPRVHKPNNGPLLEPHKPNPYHHAICKVCFNVIEPSIPTGFREVRIRVTQLIDGLENRVYSSETTI